jgi:poly(3-hydroxybutyrate) depolymerase
VASRRTATPSDRTSKFGRRSSAPDSSLNACTRGLLTQGPPGDLAYGLGMAYNGVMPSLAQVCATTGAAFATMAVLIVACSDASDDEPAADADEPTATASADDEPSGSYHADIELGERTYDIYVPEARSPEDPTPAVIAFHGRPGSPDTVRRESGLEALADTEGFLAVFPRGEDQRWEPASDSADVAYVEALVDDLVNSWDADPAQIFVAGFSNGADMAIVSALALPELIAGVAPVTPSGTGSVTSVIDELAAPVPVVAYIGELDGRADTGLDMLESWREGAGCDHPEPADETGEVTTTNWTCDGVPFRVHVVAGQGHVWFGSPDNREPIWASESMWEFFTELS